MRTEGGRRTRVWVALAVIGAAGVVVGLAFGWDPLAREAREGWVLLLQGEAEGLRLWLLDFGVWAPIASGLLQILSSLVPLLPGFVLSIANAMLYGALMGGLLTFSTSLLAAGICFGIARAAGRPAVERVVSAQTLARVDRFLERRGWWAVFWGRLLPFINPDVVSYAAGLSRLGGMRFLGAMGAGALPATIFYSIIGATAIRAAPWAIAMVSAATLLPLFLIWYFREKISRRFMEEEGEVRGDDGAG